MLGIKYVVVVYPDAPVPVEHSDFPSKITENKLNLMWSKPGDSRTPLIHFIVYQRLLNKDDSVHDWSLVKWKSIDLHLMLLEWKKTKCTNFQELP